MQHIIRPSSQIVLDPDPATETGNVLMNGMEFTTTLYSKIICNDVK